MPLLAIVLHRNRDCLALESVMRGPCVLRVVRSIMIAPKSAGLCPECHKKGRDGKGCGFCEKDHGERRTEMKKCSCYSCPLTMPLPTALATSNPAIDIDLFSDKKVSAVTFVNDSIQSRFNAAWGPSGVDGGLDAAARSSLP